jgi:hypothetical protein
LSSYPDWHWGVEGVMVLKQLDCEITQVHILLILRMLGAINHNFSISSQHVAQLNPLTLILTSVGSVLFISYHIYFILLYFIILNTLYGIETSNTVLDHVTVEHFVLVSPLDS